MRIRLPEGQFLDAMVSAWRLGGRTACEEMLYEHMPEIRKLLNLEPTHSATHVWHEVTRQVLERVMMEDLREQWKGGGIRLSDDDFSREGYSFRMNELFGKWGKGGLL